MVDSISKNYRYVVIDNEAGMEHLSRRTTRDVQALLVVSDPTQRGIVAAERIASFRHDMDINIENTYLILNRLRSERSLRRCKHALTHWIFRCWAWCRAARNSWNLNSAGVPWSNGRRLAGLPGGRGHDADDSVRRLRIVRRFA